MNTDNLEGAARGMIGKTQEAFGNATGDSRHQAEGIARQVAGRAQDAYGEVRDGAEAAARQVGHVVKEQPVVSLLVAGVIGYALGLLTIGAIGGTHRRYW